MQLHERPGHPALNAGFIVNISRPQSADAPKDLSWEVI